MVISNSDKFISWLTLLCGLLISSVAIYYSVTGLVSIFPTASVPIIIMGSVLEVSKLVATVWLKNYWHIAPKIIKSYLLVAVFVLMTITSIGIFGFLSRSHSEQSLPSGDIVDKISIIDEKIKTQQDIISNAKKDLEQLNIAVNEVVNRSSSVKGIKSSISIRQSQTNERDILYKAIQDSQNEISKLNLEKVPLSQQLRKTESEVGPLKYIAALIYSGEPNNDILEKSVRYVIILIVSVFDPLAVIMLLASQYSFKYIRDNSEIVIEEVIPPSITRKGVRNRFKKETNDEQISDVNEIVELPEDDQELDAKYKVKKAKTQWKTAHQDDTIKRQEKLYSLGLIDELPWESVEYFDEQVLNKKDQD